MLLDEPSSTITSALDHLGFVQIDPINVVGRMHDLILRHRVTGYSEGDLMWYLHGSVESPLPKSARQAFEHHAPDTGNLAAFPLSAWPHLLAAMHRRSKATGAWSGKLTPREKALSSHILEEMAKRGPLSSEDIDDDRKGRRVWGSATLAKTTLQKLFFHGHVLISRRIAQRRVYDLPERVLPKDILSAPVPPASETTRWLAVLKLRQRRLVALKRTELQAVEDLVQPIQIIDLPTGVRCPTLYCLAHDTPILDRAETATPNPSITLLAPLDPLIYDRRVTLALWDFDYTWEAYTPAHRRVRGYYALPILAGTELVGHVDAKADRQAGRLKVISRRVRRGHRPASTLRQFAQWLGLGKKK